MSQSNKFLKLTLCHADGLLKHESYNVEVLYNDWRKTSTFSMSIKGKSDHEWDEEFMIPLSADDAIPKGELLFKIRDREMTVVDTTSVSLTKYFKDAKKLTDIPVSLRKTKSARLVISLERMGDNPIDSLWENTPPTDTKGGIVKQKKQPSEKRGARSASPPARSPSPPAKPNENVQIKQRGGGGPMKQNVFDLTNMMYHTAPAGYMGHNGGVPPLMSPGGGHGMMMNPMIMNPMMMNTGMSPMMMNAGMNPMMMNTGMNPMMNTGMNPMMNPMMMNGGMNPMMNGGMNPMMNGGMNPMMNGGMNPMMNGGMNTGMIHGGMTNQTTNQNFDTTPTNTIRPPQINVVPPPAKGIQPPVATDGVVSEQAIADLLSVIPHATPEDAMKAIRTYPNDREAAIQFLAYEMMQKAAKTQQAQALLKSSIYHALPPERERPAGASPAGRPGGGGMMGLGMGLLGAMMGVPLPLMGFQDFMGSPQGRQPLPKVPPPPKMLPETLRGKRVPPTGRRKALLIGINYEGTPSVLRGAREDTRRIKKLLTTVYGFEDRPECVTQLTDAPENKCGPRQCYLPTKQNILAGMQWLISECMPGDVLVFHYSGHGSQVAAMDGRRYEADGKDETICPLDFKSAGQLTDDHLNYALVDRLPEGVKLIALMDCCHSGTGLDLPFEYIPDQMGNTSQWKEHRVKRMPVADVVLISGCASHQTSADVGVRTNWKMASGGALTLALIMSLVDRPFQHTHRSLISAINRFLIGRGFSQVAQLSSSQRFNLDRGFTFDDIVPNSNRSLSGW